MPDAPVYNTNLRVFSVLGQFEQVLFHHPLEPVCWAIAIPGSHVPYIAKLFLKDFSWN